MYEKIFFWVVLAIKLVLITTNLVLAYKNEDWKPQREKDFMVQIQAITGNKSVFLAEACVNVLVHSVNLVLLVFSLKYYSIALKKWKAGQQDAIGHPRFRQKLRVILFTACLLIFGVA
mmetsp:Transcript_30451/g.37483  ORF Transcript_30451/g.37483 Transcript_30451/m.37483 type:complete len:118 (-) Transcript_30451:100-453(-)